MQPIDDDPGARFRDDQTRCGRRRRPRTAIRPAAARRAALGLLLALSVAACGRHGDAPPPLPPATAKLPGVGHRCTRSENLNPGPTDGALYRTMAAFEHADPERTHVFARACTLAELSDGKPWEIAVRAAPGDYSLPYDAQTRQRNQLYVYGYGATADQDGAFVASIDPDTLAERWRTHLYDRVPKGQWSWPGVVTVHGNGYLYSVYGNQLFELDPDSGHILVQRALPEGPDGAVYNGMDVLADGRLVLKNMEEGDCPGLDLFRPDSSPAAELLSAGTRVEALSGMACFLLRNKRPSTMVVVDPEQLQIVDQLQLPEPTTGRITVAKLDGRQYIYVPGRTELFRYRYDGHHVVRDRSWIPAPYVRTGQGPAAAASIMNDWVILHVNGFARAGSLVAIDARNAKHVFRIDPFPLLKKLPLGPSFVLSKPAVDPDNDVVVAIDSFALRIGAFKLDPKRGFTRLWTRPALSLAFSALIGPPDQRQIVVPDAMPHDGQPLRDVFEDHVLWLDEASGKLLAESPVLANHPAPGNIVMPGFDGRFYYLGADGRLSELSVRAKTS